MQLLQAAHLRAVHRMLHTQFISFVLLLALCMYADYHNQFAKVRRNAPALAMAGCTGQISGNEIFRIYAQGSVQSCTNIATIFATSGILKARGNLASPSIATNLVLASGCGGLAFEEHIIFKHLRQRPPSTPSGMWSHSTFFAPIAWLF